MKVAVLMLVGLGLWLGSMSFAGEGLSPQPMTFPEAWAACLRQGLTLPELSQLKQIEPRIGAQLARIEAPGAKFLWTLSKNAHPEFSRAGYSWGQRHAVMVRTTDRGIALCVQPSRTPASDLMGTLRKQVERNAEE